MLQKSLAILTMLPTSIATPLLAVSCSYVKNDNDQSDVNESINITADDFFPFLDVNDYYDYVEFDQQANPIIGDKFIMKVIEDVVNRVSSSKGKIYFSVNRFSQATVDFNFKWIYNDYHLYKTYSFDIRK